MISYDLSTSSFNHQRKYITCVKQSFNIDQKSASKMASKYQSTHYLFRIWLAKKASKMNQKWLPESSKILQSSSQTCLFLAWLGSEAPEADFESLPGCFWGVLGRRLGAPWGGSGVSEAFLERSGAASGRFLKGFGCRLGVRMRFEAASGRFLKRFAHFKRFQCALQWRRGISWVMFKVLQRIKTHRYIDISIYRYHVPAFVF